MKKLFKILLTAMLILCMLFSFVACGESKEADEETPSTQEENDYYLTLNSYEITLGVGETFVLDIKKFNEKDEETEISSISYSSDAPKVAEIANGTITAKQNGTTYVHIIADGIPIACFVNVKTQSTKLDGFIIVFTTQQLYVGVNAQAYARIYDNGICIAEPTITWSVSDNETIAVTPEGMVYPKKATDCAQITAQCAYLGETYTVTKNLEIVEPIYYAFSASDITLASPETLSGESNSTYVTKTISLMEVNVVSGETRALTIDEYEVCSDDETVAQVEKQADNRLQIAAKAVGKVRIIATVKDTPVIAMATIHHAIASVADMDTLALASYNDPILLQENFLLVSDIDYQGDVIMPITVFCDNATKDTATNLPLRSAGIQWKYRLIETDDGYAFVNRADFGKTGYGLTDEQFKRFHDAGGWNPKNANAFTGKFDGNGYSIKNAKLFYGIMQLNAQTDYYYATYSNIFGMVRGTICNLALENLKLQNPKDIPLLKNAVAANGTIVENGLIQSSSGMYYYRGASLIGQLNGGTVQNVYIDLDTSDLYQQNDGLISAAITCWGKGALRIENCVVKLNVIMEAGAWHIYGVNGANNPEGYYANNLVIGAETFNRDIDKNAHGSNGNYWCKTATMQWSDLLSLQPSDTVVNAKTVQQTIESYDSAVWDMSNFTLAINGAPMLKKGCSMNK